MLDSAWTSAVGARVGFTLMTARNRGPAENGSDSPLNLWARTSLPLLGRIGGVAAGPMKYRDNGVADDQELDVRIMRVRDASQVPDPILRHGPRPIYAGAMRNYLLNNPDELSSYHPDGPAGEYAGELRVAGGIRVDGSNRGIVVVNSRDQLQSHIAAAHWALMASQLIDRKIDTFPEGEVSEITEAMAQSMASVLGEIGAMEQVTMDMPHEAFQPLIDQATVIMLQQGNVA